jgi:DNA recombination protein RmuC
VNAQDVISPRLEFAKTIEKVKKIERKETVRKRGIAAKLYGSTKNTIKKNSPHKKTVMRRSGKKFLLNLICFLLFSLSTGYILNHPGVKISKYMDWLLVLIIILGFGVVIYFVNKKLSDYYEKQKPSDELLEYLRTTNIRLNEQSRTFNQRLDNATRVISDVQKNLGEMSEVGRGIRSLQEFLQSPKLRGGLGEEVLKEMIEQSFPKNAFHLQYSFKSGAKVDAVLKTEAGLLCIDSKFPMENFKRMIVDSDSGKSDATQGHSQARKDFISDVKKHVDDIAKKYILPEEGTMDFALMYIPSESVYYEVVNIPELINFSRRLRVYPVSPNTLYAHLQVLLLSFEGSQLEAKSREVFNILRAVQKDYEKVTVNLSVLQKHFTNAYNTLSTVLTGFNQLGQKITSTRSLGQGVKGKIKKLGD